jgi:integrase
MKNVSEFMMNLHKELISVRGVTDSTASQQIRSLYSLNNLRPFANLAWLKNKESVAERLKEFAPSTQKSVLGVVVSALSLVKDKATYKKIYAHYYSEMMSALKDGKEKDTSVKTETQEKNWLSWDVVKAHEERLAEEVKALSGSLTPGKWEVLLSFAVLSLFTKFDPRRNQDYQLMYVVKNAKQATDKERNYYLLDSHQFVFQKYKTAKAHGTQQFEVPKPLVEDLKVFLSFHPLRKSKTAYPLLTRLDGTPLVAVNSITRILNRIFGKHVGSSMLRHIYLSEKYDIKDMNETSSKMGHTTNMAIQYAKTDTTE